MAEQHSRYSQYLHDFIIGFADGLTVPFALTAGLSSLGSSKLVVMGGLAELFSGAISMGLGAYLAGVTDRQRYKTELQREQSEIEHVPDQEKEEIYQILCSYGPNRTEARPFVEALCRNEDQWVQFMMRFELKLEEPKRREAYLSALIMGLAYFIGGLLPMIPYFATASTSKALFASIGVTALMLVIFGYFKAKFFGCTPEQSAQSAVTTLWIGATAAGASYGIVRGIDSSHTI